MTVLQIIIKSTIDKKLPISIAFFLEYFDQNDTLCPLNLYFLCLNVYLVRDENFDVFGE